MELFEILILKEIKNTGKIDISHIIENTQIEPNIVGNCISSLRKAKLINFKGITKEGECSLDELIIK